ncbi:hypothetical protein MKW94_003979 [Papaver nudicaule]|uniref:3'-5' exonuclease domain-containing protein n=1 Tax=Papaver nudicaule TaxID=74823 RepID=A0AA41SGF3_PAPNU|nr:hypothetical protein [Papaver nudicaule]
MAGSSSVQKVQNGLSDVSLNGGSKWGDQMSSKSSSSDGGSVRGGDKNKKFRKNNSSNGGDKNKKFTKNTYIEVFDKSKSTHHYYNVYFYKEKTIKTTVTHTASKVDQWINNVYNAKHDKLDNLIVGLDIEWRRMRNYQSKRNKVAVLQLCVGRHCLIFQFSCCDAIPESLHDFLGNEKFIFVGSGIQSDAYKLLVDYNLRVARTEELGSLAAYELTETEEDCAESPFHGAGLKELTREILKKELPKKRGTQWSDWQKNFLRDEQVEYACLDAFVSFRLGMRLLNRGNPVHTENNDKDPSQPEEVEEE